VAFTAARRGLGANSNDLSFSTAHAKFADLDSPGPLLKELGADGNAKLLAKFNGLVTVVEDVVRTTVVDLSF
jgi:hypothetical protein